MQSNSLPVLVIGGAGYIGSHVVLELCEQGIPVVVFDNLSSGYKENIDSRASFIEGDILNISDLSHCFKQPYRAVFHFAALKAAGESMVNPQYYSTTNISGSINILNQMIESGTRSIIFSSTAAVYGDPQYLPMDESHPLCPSNFYGFTKLTIENFCQWYNKVKGIKFAALRYFNAVGYDEQGRISGLEKNPANLLPLVMEAAAGIRDHIKVFGNDYDTHDGTGVRDYIHVSDLASAHFKALNYIESNRDNLTVNLSTGNGYSVLEIIQKAKDITGNNIPYTISARRDGDPATVVAGSKIAHQLLDWKCSHSKIENSLKTMWNVYANHIQ